MESNSNKEVQTYALENGLSPETTAALHQVSRATKLPPLQAHRLLKTSHGNAEKAIELFQDLIARKGSAVVAPSTVQPKPPTPPAAPAASPPTSQPTSSKSAAILMTTSEVVVVDRPEYSPPNRSLTLLGGVLVEKRRSKMHLDPSKVFILSKYRNITNVGSRPFRYYLRPNLSVYIHSCQNLKPSGLHQVEVQLNGQPGPRTGWIEGAPYPDVRTTFEFDNFDPEKAWIRIIVWERHTLRGHRQVGDLIISSGDLKDVEPSLLPASFPMRVRFLKTTRYLEHRDISAAKLTCEILMTEHKGNTTTPSSTDGTGMVEVGVQTGEREAEDVNQSKAAPYSRSSTVDEESAIEPYSAARPLLGDDLGDSDSADEEEGQEMFEAKAVPMRQLSDRNEKKKDKMHKKRTKKKQKGSSIGGSDDPFATSEQTIGWSDSFEPFAPSAGMTSAPVRVNPATMPVIGPEHQYHTTPFYQGAPVLNGPLQRPAELYPPQMIAPSAESSISAPPFAFPPFSMPVHSNPAGQYFGCPTMQPPSSTVPMLVPPTQPQQLPTQTVPTTIPQAAPMAAQNAHHFTSAVVAPASMIPGSAAPVSNPPQVKELVHANNTRSAEESQPPQAESLLSSATQRSHKAGLSDRSTEAPSQPFPETGSTPQDNRPNGTEAEWPQWPDQNEMWPTSAANVPDLPSPNWDANDHIETKPVPFQSMSDSMESSIDSSESSENWPPAPMPNEPPAALQAGIRKANLGTRVFDIPERSAQQSISPQIDFSTDLKPIESGTGAIAAQAPVDSSADQATEAQPPTIKPSESKPHTGEHDWFAADHNPWAEINTKNVDDWAFS